MNTRTLVRTAVTLAAVGVTLATTACGVRARRTDRIVRAVAAFEATTKATTDTARYLTPFGPPTRPFSPAVRVGDLIFLSGQIATDPSAAGGLVTGGIEAETRQTMDNIRTLLSAVGSSMDKVVKCTVMMADMAEWDRMNAVYRTYFKPGRLPTRSAFGATGLALGARVEIECIASA